VHTKFRSCTIKKIYTTGKRVHTPSSLLQQNPLSTHILHLRSKLQGYFRNSPTLICILINQQELIKFTQIYCFVNIFKKSPMHTFFKSNNCPYSQHNTSGLNGNTVMGMISLLNLIDHHMATTQF